MSITRMFVAFSIVALLIVNSVSASSIVMQGSYVKTAISENGTLGYGASSSPGLLHDENGTGYFGVDDYLTPGAPWEVFYVQSDQTGLRGNNNVGTYYGEISNSSIEDLSGDKYDNHVRWTGNYSGYYEIIINYFFNDDEERVNVVTEIIAERNLTGLKFLRAIDPDPDVITYGTYLTENGRGFDLNKDGDYNDYGDIDPSNWVHSVGPRTGLTLGLYSNSSYTHGTGVSSSWSTNPDFYLNGTNNGNGDYTIGLAYDLGNLNLGESKVFNYSYVMGDLVENASVPWVPSVIYEKQPKPEYCAIPEIKEGDNVIVIAHGWNSNPEVWANGLADSIKNDILEKKAAGIITDESDWFIFPYDWRNSANTILPVDAWNNARRQGKRLAAELNKLPINHIHFIAHSAGSNLIQNAVEAIKEDDSTPPIIHATFLDSYHPVPVFLSGYGKKADWAEQYVDTRRLIANWTDTTDSYHYNLFNFDVTDLDPDGYDDGMQERHSWPFEYYNQSVFDDLIDEGYKLSFESGEFTSQSSWLDNVEALYPPHFYTVLDSPYDYCYSPTIKFPDANMSTSYTGTVYIVDQELIGLKTGSPVWASILIDVTEPVNIIKFDYEFLSDANGLLTIFFDDKIIFDADETYTPKGLNSEHEVLLGNIEPGKHTISFRLDIYDGKQSVVEISKVQLGLATEITVSPEDIDDDGDGITENEGDCNDDNSNISPGALEVCDDLDNNCDGNVDEAGYLFSGFLPPVKEDGSGLFKAGRTIPVKVEITECSGLPASQAIVSAEVYKISDIASGTEEVTISESSGDANEGNLFRFNGLDGLHIFNLSTKPYKQGTYKIKAQCENGQYSEAFFSIK